MFSTFNAVFEALSNIEAELEKGVSGEDKQRIVDTLVSLRSTMDKCVHYWIKFEEKVSSLQEKHKLELPDTLPESFLDELTFFGEDSQENTPPADSLENENNNPSENSPFPASSSQEYQDKSKALQQSLDHTFKKISEEKAILSFRKGLGFWDLAMVQDAAEEFEKVTRIEPNFITGHFFLGIASSYNKDYDRALRELKLVIALDSDDILKALSYNTIGSVYADRGNLDAALENFRKAAEVKPQLKEACFNQGAVHFNRQDFQTALTAFKKYLELNPEDWEALFFAGKACARLEKWDEALSFLDKAYRLNPREPLITFETGVIYRLLEQHQKAAVYFNATRRMLESPSPGDSPGEGI